MLLARWMFSLEQTTAGRILFGRTAWMWFYRFRRFRSGAIDMGDVRFENDPIIPGLWVRSEGRVPNYDIVLFWIHGGGMVTHSPYMYLEFMTALVTSLHMQGFRSPAIFMLKHSYAPEHPFPHQLDEAAVAWNYLQKEHPAANFVFAGDGSGANLALSLLLHLTRPCLGVTECLTNVKPQAALLLSPWPNWKTSMREETENCYFSAFHLRRYRNYYIARAKETSPYFDLSCVTSLSWWKESFPEKGMYLIYGTEEMFANEIEELYGVLRLCGPIKIDGELRQIHCWPITTHFLARDEYVRGAGVFAIALNLGKMLIWGNDVK
ncbi:Alpha/Beta hydrolase protein [Yarrowia lipolytica]|uniref:Alpha/Beta hydrolase protein n=1 Tax=Yarrowia lipolytica TaxID=4952 RepID=A0A371CB27_YARLL|nr:Alpha/Beta hydrolase protein [Yarrowia lipolytica]RDW34397.1 Alpha/Beta hydrolase protein [Yarrowia lipolytica]